MIKFPQSTKQDIVKILDIELPVAIRDYDKTSDEDFLYSTWMKSYSESSWGRSIPVPLYNIGQRKRIDRIMENPKTYILVACQEGTPELIFGYMVGELPSIIHYLYVKNAYRNSGIAHRLLYHLGNSPIITYTHKPKDIYVGNKLKELDHWIYNPYLLER